MRGARPPGRAAGGEDEGRRAAASAARLFPAGRAAACVGHGRGRAGQIRRLCALSCARLCSLRPMDSAIRTGHGGTRCCPSYVVSVTVCEIKSSFLGSIKALFAFVYNYYSLVAMKASTKNYAKIRHSWENKCCVQLWCRPRFPEGSRAFQKLAREPTQSRGGTSRAPWRCVQFGCRHGTSVSIRSSTGRLSPPAGMGELLRQPPDPLL